MSLRRRHILLAITVLFFLLTIGLQSCGSKDDPPPLPPPYAPTGVSATSGDGQATIRWDSISDAASYILYMAETTGVTKTSNTMKHTNVTSPFTHTGLTNGTTYSFVVTVVNSAGESAESSEVSATPLPNAQSLWNQLGPGPLLPLERREHSAVFDATNDRMIIFGGKIASGFANDVWVLSNATGLNGTPTWTQLIPTGTPPPARYSHIAVYDSANNRMIVFGGGDQKNKILMDLWVLSNANGLGGTPIWSQLSPTAIGTVLSRANATGVYDATNNRLIFFGGVACPTNQTTCNLFNEVWVLSNANGLGGTPTAIQITVSGNVPSPRSHHTAVYDATNNKMIIGGGNSSTAQILDPVSYLNDVWVLSNANGLGGTATWSLLNASGGQPPARSDHTAIYDESSNRLIVFGGAGRDNTVRNDLWILSNANGSTGQPVWAEYPGVPPLPAARVQHTAIYSSAQNKMVVFGGDTGNSTLVNDVWVLRDANGVVGKAGITNDIGQVVLKVNDRDISFSFVDETTGSPISGLAVGYEESGDKGVMLIVDPYKQYPLHLVVIQRSTPDNFVSKTELSSESTSNVEIPLNSGPISIIRKLEIPTSDKPSSPSIELVKFAVDNVGKAATIVASLLDTMTDGKLAALAEDLKLGETEELDTQEAKSRVKEDMKTAVFQRIGTFIKSGGTAVNPVIAGFILDGILYLGQQITLASCEHPGEVIKITTLGNTVAIIGCGASIYPTDTSGFVSVPVSVTEQSSLQPISQGAIVCVSKTAIGVGISAVLDTGGNALLPVPVGNYACEVQARRFSSKTIDLSVPTSGTSLTLDLQSQPIAKVTLSSTPGLTGFLDPGTQVQFTAVATDINRTVVSCDPVFIAGNPVGSTVATIDSKTGLLTVGPDDGAVKVTARCGGVTSNPILVSGTGQDFTLSVGKAGDGSGTVSANPPCCTYSSGAVVALTAIPASDSTFAGWSGACSGTGSCVITMDADKTITATFNKNTTEGDVTFVSATPINCAPPTTSYLYHCTGSVTINITKPEPIGTIISVGTDRWCCGEGETTQSPPGTMTFSIGGIGPSPELGPIVCPSTQTIVIVWDVADRNEPALAVLSGLSIPVTCQ